MTTKRVNLLAITILGGALLLGTAGLVFAQDGTNNPSPSATSGMSGDMMSGDMMSGGMMSGVMMDGQGKGMMDGRMGAGQMPDVAAMHAAMVQDGTCDPEHMQSMHQQNQPTR